MLDINKQLYYYLIKELGAYYEQHTNEVKSNLNNSPEDNKWYLGTYFPKLRFVYAFIILASIFTTAISIGMGLLQNISKNKKSYTQFVLFMCITSLLISNIGFSKLVNFIYPLFGYIGIIQIILINAYK